MSRAIKTLFILALILGLPLHSLAFDPGPELFNARALALGGAVVSVPGKTLSARSNPAALAPIKGFYLGGSYVWRESPTLDGVNLTLVDNSTAPIAGALNYHRVVTKGETEEVGLSLAAGTGGYFWGVTGRFAHTRNDKKGDWKSAFVGDLGLLITRENGLMIGVAARDLLDSSYEAVERRVAGGLSMTFQNSIMVAADYVRYFDHSIENGSSQHFGVEWRPNQTPWALRGGYMRDGISETDFISMGLGWTNQKFDIDYGYMRGTENGEGNTHILTVSYPF